MNLTSGPTIHPHWLQYYEDGQLPASEWVHTATFIYISVIGMTGLVGNGAVFWTFLRSKLLRSPSAVLVSNLALSEFAISLIELIFICPSSFARRWLFAESGCSIYAFAVGLFGMSSIGTMTAIAIHRHRSLSHYDRGTYPKAAVAIFVIYFFALAMVLPPLFGWSQYLPESIQTSCTFDYLTRTPENISFNVYLFVAGFVLPVGVMTFCYISVIHRIIQRRASSRPPTIQTASWLFRENRVVRGRVTFGPLPTNVPFPSSDHRKETLSCILIVILFCISWLPYAIVAFLGIFGDQSLLTPMVTFLPVLFAKSSAVHTPIIYIFTNKRFRDALFKDGCSGRRPPPTVILTSYWRALLGDCVSNVVTDDHPHHEEQSVSRSEEAKPITIRTEVVDDGHRSAVARSGQLNQKITML